MGLYELDDDYEVLRNWDTYLHDEGDAPENDITFADCCNFFGRLLEEISDRGLTADLLGYEADDPEMHGEAYIIAYLHWMGLVELHKKLHSIARFIEDLKAKEARGEITVHLDDSTQTPKSLF